jgi:hypothetical protein
MHTKNISAARGHLKIPARNVGEPDFDIDLTTPAGAAHELAVGILTYNTDNGESSWDGDRFFEWEWSGADGVYQQLKRLPKEVLEELLWDLLRYRIQTIQAVQDAVKTKAQKLQHRITRWSFDGDHWTARCAACGKCLLLYIHPYAVFVDFATAWDDGSQAEVGWWRKMARLIDPGSYSLTAYSDPHSDLGFEPNLASVMALPEKLPSEVLVHLEADPLSSECTFLERLVQEVGQPQDEPCVAASGADADEEVANA